MKKIIMMLVVFMFILTGNLIATPITLENTITFSSSGATSSSDGAGQFIVTLASLGGDFYIDSARLGVNYNGVNYNTAPAPVPEPASLLLLGVGLLSVGIFARKRNKNN